MPIKSKEKRQKYNKEYWSKHRDEARAQCRKFYRENPEKKWAYDLKRIYNITVEQYNEIVVRQNGVCAICLQPNREKQNEKEKRLCVDHSHKTGNNRGLLCGHCNKGLGQFSDSPILLEKALKYLLSYEQ